MRKIKKSVAVIIISALAVMTLAFLPPAIGETTGEDVEIKASESFELHTDASGKITGGRLVEFMGLSGDGTVDIEHENKFENQDFGWQGVKSFKIPKVEGDKLIWEEVDVEGDQNLISATELSDEMVDELNERIPLDLKYRYFLDGIQYEDPAEFVGQDGHFRLELTMTNTSKELTEVEYEDPETGEMVTEEVETYLPLVVVPYDWYFDTDVFYNIQTDPTGLIVAFPQFYTCGWQVPLFPPASEDTHTIWVEADVKDFHMPTLVLSCNFVFPGTNQRDPIPEFQASLGELHEGVIQLDEGLAEAATGLGSADTPDTLLYGTNEILSGLKEMAAGIRNDMIPGVGEMVAGLGSEGTPDTLLYAIDATTAGLNDMKAGIGETFVPDSLLYAMSEMGSGLNEMKEGIGSQDTPDTLLYGADQTAAGLEEMKAGIGEAAMEDTLLYAVDQTMRGMGDMKLGIGAPGTPKSLLDGMGQIAGGLDEINAVAMAQMRDGLQQMVDGVGAADIPDTALFALHEIDSGLSMLQIGAVGAGASLGLAIAHLNHDGPIVGTSVKTLISDHMPEPYRTQAINKINNTINIEIGIGGAYCGLAAVMMGTPCLDGTLRFGIDQLRLGMEDMKGGIGDLLDGIDQTQDGIGLLLAGVAEVQAGLNDMQAGIGGPSTPDTLMYALAQIEGGLKLMSVGIGEANAGDSLLYAMSAMTSGLEDMKAGIGSETTADTLLYAVAQVQAGLELMRAGIGDEGTSDSLIYAMAQVQFGLNQMSEGLASGDPNAPGLMEGLYQVSSGLGSISTDDTLLYGVNAIDEGLAEMKEGMTQATDEGTALMLEGLVEGLAELNLTVGELEAVAQRGEEFNHLLGRAENAENVMTFVIETPPSYSYEEGSSWKTALILIIAIGLIMIGAGVIWRLSATR